MASGQTESSIFNKERTFPPQQITQQHTRCNSAFGDVCWVLISSKCLQESIGTLDLIFSTRFSTQIFQDICTCLTHQRAICESDQQNTSLIVICIEIASKTAFICSEESKHDNSSSRGIDNKPFEQVEQVDI